VLCYKEFEWGQLRQGKTCLSEARTGFPIPHSTTNGLGTAGGDGSGCWFFASVTQNVGQGAQRAALQSTLSGAVGGRYPLVYRGDSVSDSEEDDGDEPAEDEHRPRKIEHAMREWVGSNQRPI
jgi:hypothetical protein